MGISPILVLLLVFVTVDCRNFNISIGRRGNDYVIESPRYPNNAPSFSNVIWQLTAPEDQKIILTCNNIRFLKRTGCTEGSLTVWDGLTRHNICNVMQFYQRESKRNRMQVQFRSGWFGVGQVSCRARGVERSILDAMSEETDSREHGQGIGSKTTSCPCGWTNKKRIVGGKESGINEYPFVVSILLKEGRRRFCGGSIITPYHILTAAHCTYGLNEAMAVIVGEHDFSTDHETNATKSIRVKKIIEHEKYVHSDMINDIAILELAEKIEYNQYVGPVCLPSMKYRLLHEHLKVLGWGFTSDGGGKFSDVLLKVNLRVVELSKCALSYTNFIDLVNQKQICTHSYRRDSCNGDSGGPLLHLDPEINRYVEVSLVSYGRECASDIPAVNTDVYFYKDWIEAQVNKHEPAVSTCEKIN